MSDQSKLLAREDVARRRRRHAAASPIDVTSNDPWRFVKGGVSSCFFEWLRVSPPYMSAAQQGLEIDPNALPRHIAIIMDGNGRWAHQRGLPRIEGHRRGAESVRDVVRAARAIGIKTLTLFAFSEQNWDRPTDEVGALMELLYRYVLEEREEIMGNDIRLTAVGALDRLPTYVREPLFKLMELSVDRESMVLCLALSYGGREDIANAARRLAEEAAAGSLDPAAIDVSALEARLATTELPEVDLLIRTSGELRLSNFLLWQLAYAELIFSQTMWPEFRKTDLLQAIAEYQHRERRYGLTSEQLPRGSKPEAPDWVPTDKLPKSGQ